jgi:4'-phosphopantetheinyl transferase EntD
MYALNLLGRVDEKLIAPGRWTVVVINMASVVSQHGADPRRLAEARLARRMAYAARKRTGARRALDQPDCRLVPTMHPGWPQGVRHYPT